MKIKISSIWFVLIIITICAEGRKLSRSRGSSGRGSGRKTNYNPSPTSLSYPQPSAPKPQPKPSLFGWQEGSAQRTQTSQSRQSKPSKTQTHSYPSSQTGLSGNTHVKQPTNQGNVQTNSQSNSQASHSYPSSNGLSGNSGSGAKYPQGSGLSGTGNAAAPPPYSAGSYPTNRQSQTSANGYPNQQVPASGGAAMPPPYSAGQHHPNNYGSNYHNPQAPPPPYYNNYGGYGGNHGNMHNQMHAPQMPGYFGNDGKGYGGVSRSGSALTGVGIAGAGVGTLLTGLALWNLARSTGHRHHTVIYDNRGQPVAVAPNNSTEPVVDPILGDLVNCSLTISTDNATEILAIPCAIATSFTPEADVKDVDSASNRSDNTKCIVTVVTKAGREFMTTIPCSILLKTAAENNVTEPPTLLSNETISTIIPSDVKPSTNGPVALGLSGEDFKSSNCTPEPGDLRDPINPCFSVTHNLTVIPLINKETSTEIMTTPSTA